MTKPDKALIEHYRAYMNIYACMIIELAVHDEEIIKFINGSDELGLLMQGLRERIENSPFYE